MRRRAFAFGESGIADSRDFSWKTIEIKCRWRAIL
jgi:hypothetical protein